MHIVHVISSLKLGGAETCLLSLITYLRNQNYTQTVLYFHDGPIRHEIELLGVHTQKISGRVYQYDPIFLIRLYRTLKRLQPDIVHSSLWAANFFSSIYARLLKVPLISALHTVQEHEGQMRNFLTQFSLPLAHKIIAVAPAVALSAQKKYKLKPAQITVIPNGVNMQALHHHAALSCVSRQQLGLSPHTFIIGSVGRFVQVKNYHYLLEICAQLLQKNKNIHLILLGYGPEQENLENRARILGIAEHVTFIIGEPAYRYYQLFNCFVQPSLFEGLSIALLEALSFGVPTIVASQTGSHDVIEHEVTGILCDHARLKQAVELLYLDPELCKKLSNAGAERVREKYSLDSMGKQYEVLFSNYASR